MRKWTLPAFGLLAFSGQTLADPSWRDATINFVLVQDGGTTNDQGIVVIELASNAQYLPSCHTSALRNRVMIDLSRAPAKSQLALVLAIYSAGKTVNIDVNESCAQGVALVRNIF